MDEDARHSPPGFDAAGRLIAPRYDDPYFSITDGLAETTHVFLQGNGLAERFVSMPPGERFTVGETGFGTGLNFLATWRLFEQSAPADATLRFVSVENQPLSGETIKRALAPWPVLSPWLDRLLAEYRPPESGEYRISLGKGNVELVLLIGEVEAALTNWQTPIDTWFLDGFAPSRNPAMWSPKVFAQVARLSHAEQPYPTTLATYTAAGFVRRGLSAVGFQIEKRPGFGTKRDMTAGRFGGTARAFQSAPRDATQAEAVIIGAGLAGSFAARALADRGIGVTVLERQPMSAGGLVSMRLRVALLQPKINDQSDPPGNRLREGFGIAHRIVTEQLADDPRLGWRGCGAFHAAHDARSEKRLRRFVEQFGGTGLCRWIDQGQTQAETGVALSHDGIVIDQAGLLRPGGLCEALLDHPRIAKRGGYDVVNLRQCGKLWQVHVRSQPVIETQRVVIANALDASALGPAAHLELRPVRGQVSLITTGSNANNETVGPGALRRVFCFGGYLTPAIDGRHTLGASFVPGDDSTDWREDEHVAVCERLRRVEPAIAASHLGQHDGTGWAGVRVTTPSRVPYAGPVERDGRPLPGIYASLGHGSHGICSAAIAAQQIADLIAKDVGIPQCSKPVANAPFSSADGRA